MNLHESCASKRARRHLNLHGPEASLPLQVMGWHPSCCPVAEAPSTTTAWPDHAACRLRLSQVPALSDATWCSCMPRVRCASGEVEAWTSRWLLCMHAARRVSGGQLPASCTLLHQLTDSIWSLITALSLQAIADRMGRTRLGSDSANAEDSEAGDTEQP